MATGFLHGVDNEWMDTSGLLPTQMPTSYLRVCVGERLLLAAVLQDAVELVTGARVGHWKTVREAIQWIQSDRGGDLMDFVRVCEALELDPEAVRAQTRARSERHRPLHVVGFGDARARAASRWKAKQRRRVA